MEPKVTLVSRDKKKKVPLLPMKKALPSSQEQQKNLKRSEFTKRKKDSNEIYWRPTPVPPVKKKKRKSRQEILSIVFSIVGAILVGVIMGASLLSIFFTNEPTYSKNSIDSHLYTNSKQQDSRQALQTMEVYLLQAGNFKHQSGAESRVRAYRKQGLAAVMSSDAPYRIYMGVSFDHNDAVRLAENYQKRGIHVYIKRVSIPLQPLRQASTLHRGKTILKELSQRSIQAILQDKDAPFKLTPQLEKEYQLFLDEAEQMKNRLTKAERDIMLKRMQALDQALQSAIEANNHPSQALMFQIQEGLVRYINSFKP